MAAPFRGVCALQATTVPSPWPASPTWAPELRPLERNPQAEAQGQVESFPRPWGGPPAVLDREAFLLCPYEQPGPPGMPRAATAETSPAWSLQLLKCLYQYQRENAKRLLTPPKECSSSLALGLGPLPPQAQLWALKGLGFNLGLCDIGRVQVWGLGPQRQRPGEVCTP